MKILRKEFTHSYETYEFGYTNWAIREQGDLLSEIYENGFLPYSGNGSEEQSFYMARSVRIPLRDFEPSSENRRILKKFSIEDFDILSLSGEEASAHEELVSFCVSYFETTHGQGIMSAERIRRIFMYCKEVTVQVFRNKYSHQLSACVVSIADALAHHYWFSFFHPELAGTSFGIWLMLHVILSTKQLQKEYCYLGTAYSGKALYKTNFAPLQFWNGTIWKSDIAELKERARTDFEKEKKSV